MIWCGVMLSLTFPDREKEDNTQDNDNNGDDCEGNRVQEDGEKGMKNDSNHAYDDTYNDMNKCNMMMLILIMMIKVIAILNEMTANKQENCS